MPEKSKPSSIISQKGNPKNIIKLDRRIASPRSKKLQLRVQNFVNLTREANTVASYLITVVFPNETLEQSWDNIPGHIKTLRKLFSKYTTAYAVVGVEMHRSGHQSSKEKAALKSKEKEKAKAFKKQSAAAKELSSLLDLPSEDSSESSSSSEESFATEFLRKALESQKDNQDVMQELKDFISAKIDSATKEQETKFTPNRSLKGHAHIHVFLTLYNSFLAPTRDEILEHLLDAGFEDPQIKTVPYPSTPGAPAIDAKKCFLYCTKEGRDDDLASFVKNSLNLNSLIQLYYGLNSVVPRLKKVEAELVAAGIATVLFPLETVDLLPSIPSTSNDKVAILDFLSCLFDRHNLRLFPGTPNVWSRVPGATCTYEDTNKTLVNLYSTLWVERVNRSHFKDMMQRASTWILSGIPKLELSLLPTIEIKSHLIEFKDGIFNCDNCIFYPDKESVLGNLKTESCLRFYPFSFEELPFPETLLSSLYGTSL